MIFIQVAWAVMYEKARQDCPPDKLVSDTMMRCHTAILWAMRMYRRRSKW